MGQLQYVGWTLGYIYDLYMPLNKAPREGKGRVLILAHFIQDQDQV